jgi:RND family efflux transporter MFP subunit
MMNRETTIATPDTIIVVDSSRRKRRLMIAGIITGLIVVLIGLAMLTGKNAAKPDEAASTAKGNQPSVTVTTPGRSEVARTLTASGPLAARRDQPVGIAGGGGRVVRVLVDAGSWVRAGQVLAVVDRSVQAQQAAQLSAQVDAARANAQLAQSNYDRALALKDRGFVSKAELDSKKAIRDAAFAQVRVAQAQLGATRAQIGQLNVIAPTSGLVLSRAVEVGQIVGPGSMALFHIAEGGAMEMKAQLAQQDIALVHTGMPASVTPLGSDRAYSGTVWQVAPVIDAQTRLGEVRIAVPYNGSVRPGGYAEAKISAGVTNAAVLPQSSVLSDENGNYVYIINNRDVVERRNVKIGNVDEQGVVIASGLSGTEAVVLSAGPFLNPGQKVRAERRAAR